MKKLLYLILFMTFSCHAAQIVSANTTSKAESLYSDGRYKEALSIYKSLAKNGQSAKLYYDIANCYYRQDSLAQSILWYERANMLDPSDEDILFNLKYARSKTIDKIVPEDELFLVRWYHSLLNCFSVQGWTLVGIICFTLCLFLLCVFLFMTEIRIRKIGFFSSIILIFAVLFSNILAWQQHSRQSDHSRAIVFTNSISCKSSPNEAGKELFLLHEGTSVQILDSSVRNWLQIRLFDGKEGWIPASCVQII